MFRNTYFKRDDGTRFILGSCDVKIPGNPGFMEWRLYRRDQITTHILLGGTGIWTRLQHISVSGRVELGATGMRTRRQDVAAELIEAGWLADVE